MTTREIVLISLLVSVVVFGLWFMIAMPGKTLRGELPNLSAAQKNLRETLKSDIEQLSSTIGERNLTRPDALHRAADFIGTSLSDAGYQVMRQRYEVGSLLSENLEVERVGSDRAQEIVLIAAHYDSVEGSPGANDNASGVAALLALAREYAAIQPRRTLRFVAFANEEPPYFQTPAMGSFIYAERSHARNERIVAMLSLETIGYYSDVPGSQQYPSWLGWFYPSAANFISFVGNLKSRNLVRRVVRSFRYSSLLPSEGIATFSGIPGVGWSDQWSFWHYGYPGVMVTDTALFRYPFYHSSEDTPDKLDYNRLSLVVSGLKTVIADLVEAPMPVRESVDDKLL